MAVLEAHGAHQNLVDELLEEVATYNPEVDRELLTRAFRFAAAAHEGQQRRSGEAFIHHPWGVAKICAQLRLDEQTLAAALLHDVVEDTETELDEVRAEFGDEVTRLVDGVTKLTRVQFQSREQAEAENYRKMIVAMAEDERVILIKLADRLHNLRRSPTASVSTPSSGSSRTSPSRRSTHASTRRSRRWSRSGAPIARSTCARPAPS
jgi:(p)ppGpp synthase/HD superfamily hydrolase